MSLRGARRCRPWGLARVKVPTADSARGLGTGRFDETLGTELTQRLPSDFVAFADAGYTLIGHVPGAGLRNQWYYDLGLGYYLTKTLLGSVYYEEWRAVVQGFQNPQDLLFALNWTATDALRFNTALQFWSVGWCAGVWDHVWRQPPLLTSPRWAPLSSRRERVCSSVLDTH